MGTLTRRATSRACALRLGPGLRLERLALVLFGELRRPSARDALAQRAHVGVVVALQRRHGLVYPAP